MGAYRSIKDQKFDRWLILVNGDAKPEDIPSEIMKDPRVDVQQTGAEGVGALKAAACSRLLYQKADILLELDHDDMLAEGAIEALSDMKEDEFVFSDTASKDKYGANWGWTPRSEVVNGERHWVHDTPEVSARSLYEIFYAPNHFRAWGAKAYQQSGGYDTSLSVCDDHDLLCRTYLAGVPMRKIQKALYVQTVHEGQTQKQRNAEIQRKQEEIGARHLYALTLENARRDGLHAIDLGGRPGDAPGFKSLNKTQPADIIHNVLAGLPFEENSVGVFRAHDFLEHIPIGDVVPLMNEIYRCLAPGGWLLSSTPSTDGRGAFQDPTHCSFWNSNSFWYYTREEQAKYVPEIRCRFQKARLVNHHPSAWHKLHEIVYVDAALWALKGQRQIGAVEI